MSWVGAGGERGSVSVLVLALVAGLVLVSVGLAALGRAVAAHVQATTAADAAALAAAPLTFLPGDPEAEAHRLAESNGADLVRCTCRSDPTITPRTVTVEVALSTDLPMFGPRMVRARAAAEFDPLTLVGG